MELDDYQQRLVTRINRLAPFVTKGSKDVRNARYRQMRRLKAALAEAGVTVLLEGSDGTIISATRASQSAALFCAVEADNRTWHHRLTIEQVEAGDDGPAVVVAECPEHPHTPDPRLAGPFRPSDWTGGPR